LMDIINRTLKVPHTQYSFLVKTEAGFDNQLVKLDSWSLVAVRVFLTTIDKRQIL
jgi:hypothetical protein